MPCARCGKPSEQQWQICADGNQYWPICSQGDVVLNYLVMDFMEMADKDTKIQRYKEFHLEV